MNSQPPSNPYLMTDAFNPIIQLDGEEYDFFCSCDYHNLQEDPRLREAAQRSLFEYPFKIGPSYYGFGKNKLYSELEEISAKFFGTDTALIYPSGYFGNTVLFRALSENFDKIFVDEGSHYSMKDALVLSGKPFVWFNHCDPQDLEHKIAQHLSPNERPMIASDGVFPVSGDIAPIPAYFEIIKKFPGGIMCIDDAHATGVLGKQGRGTYEHFALNDPRLYFCGTMSKALGSHGGVIPCSHEFAKRRRKSAYIMVGSTKLPIPTVAASITAMQILLDSPEKIQKLQSNALYFKKGLRDLGFQIAITPSGMACITLGSEKELEKLYLHLKKHHVLPLFAPSKSYTNVPTTGAIKFTITSNHSKKQFNRVLEIIRQWIEKKSK